MFKPGDLVQKTGFFLDSGQCALYKENLLEPPILIVKIYDDFHFTGLDVTSSGVKLIFYGGLPYDWKLFSEFTDNLKE